MQISLSLLRSRHESHCPQPQRLYLSAPLSVPPVSVSAEREQEARQKRGDDNAVTSHVSPTDEWNFTIERRQSREVALRSAETLTSVPVALACPLAQAQPAQRVGRRVSKRRRLRYLRPLHSLLCKLFLGEELAVEDMHLSTYELCLLAEVLLRKNRALGAHMLGRSVDVAELHEWALRFSSAPSSKRLEENVKFAFKSAFKHLRSKHSAETRGSVAAPDFYAFYFGETAAAMRLPLSAFHDPLNVGTAHRTLTHELRHSSGRRDAGGGSCGGCATLLPPQPAVQAAVVGERGGGRDGVSGAAVRVSGDGGSSDYKNRT